MVNVFAPCGNGDTVDDIEDIKKEVREAYSKMVDLQQKGIKFADTLPDNLRQSSVARDSAGQLACWQKTLGCLEPRSGERYLDLGCGGGLHAYELYKLPCKYYGVDFCQAMVAEVNMGLSGRKWENVVSIINADADELPYDDRFFDLATCMGVLEYYPPDYRRRVLMELRRVLKHNGRAAVDYPNPLNPKIYDAMGIEAFRGSRIFLQDLAEVETELAECGFEVNEQFAHRVMMVYVITPHTDWTQWGIT